MSESRELYASFIRVIVQLTILAIVNWLLIELPMIKAISIPGLPVTIPACISLVIGIIMIIILLTFRRDFLPRLRTHSVGFTDLSIMLSDIVTLAIIWIAYTSFDDIIKPFMKEFSWAYAPIFLLIALWPLISLITMLYRSATPVSDWISGKIVSNPCGRNTTTPRCPSCGRFCPRGDDYCSVCGAHLIPLTENKINCKYCGAANRSTSKYCTKCGVLIADDDQYDTRVSV